MNLETLSVAVLARTDQWVTLSIPCQLSCGESAMEILSRSSLFDSIALNFSERDKFLTAVREVLWNGIEHGGKMDPQKAVRLDLIKSAKSLQCYVRDPGPGFHLPGIEHAAVNNPPDDAVQHALIRESQGMRPGGFGILMASSYVDEIIYNQPGNEVVLIRHLS